jgi:hypothetical protein
MKSSLTAKQHEEIAAGLLPILRPIVDQLRAVKQTNQEWQERCHALEARILELEATAAARGEKVGS